MSVITDDQKSLSYATSANYSENSTDSSLKYKELSNHKDFKPKLYKSRFLMMFLFCLCTMLNGFQWIQFSIVSSVLSCYYNVSIEIINWTSIIFNAMNVPFMYPVMWFFKNKGLRVTLIIASAGNALSSCVQCFSLPPNRFDVAFTSQVMASIAQVFSIPVAPFIAALWFGVNEVSTACAIGVFSNQLGAALGFIVGPLLLPSTCNDKNDVHQGLMYLAVSQAIINTVVFIAIIFCFEAKPPTPPSYAEFAKHDEPEESLFKSMCILFKDANFSFFVVSYGLLNSVYSAMATMLNQIIVKTFGDLVTDAGEIGLISSICGMVGTILFGFILDRTHKFRLMNFGIYFISLVGMISYTLIAHIKILWLHYLMLSSLGFFMVSYMVVGYELGMEISYPVPEGTSGSILCCSYQLFGVITAEIATRLQQNYGIFSSNIFMCIITFIGFFITIFIKCDMKRTNKSIISDKSIINKPLMPSA